MGRKTVQVRLVSVSPPQGPIGAIFMAGRLRWGWNSHSSKPGSTPNPSRRVSASLIKRASGMTTSSANGKRSPWWTRGSGMCSVASIPGNPGRCGERPRTHSRSSKPRPLSRMPNAGSSAPPWRSGRSTRYSARGPPTHSRGTSCSASWNAGGGSCSPSESTFKRRNSTSRWMKSSRSLGQSWHR